MKHFLCVATGLDPFPLLYSLHHQPWLWDTDTIRTTHPGSVHSAVHDVLLFFQRPEAVDPATDRIHDCFPRPAWWALPDARTLVFGLMARVQATRLGRTMITRLPAGAAIPPHTDSPAQTSYWARHQITLASPPECLFQVGDEHLVLVPGSCWRIDNSMEHSVHNDGQLDRIALIVDIHIPVMPGGVP